MTAPSWLACGILLCLCGASQQKGIPPAANGLGQVMLPAVMPGAGAAPPGAGRTLPTIPKGLGARMILNGYGNGRGPILGAGALANGRKGPKPPGYGVSNGYPRAPISIGVPPGLGVKRKPGIGVPRNGYPTGYQNGFRDGQVGQQVAFRGKQGKAPGYTNGVGGLTPAVQPVYANGYRNGYTNGYGAPYGIGYGGNGRFMNGAGIQTGAGGKVPTGYGGVAGVTNGAGLQPGNGGKALGPAGYGGAAGLINGAGLQPAAGGKGLGPAGFGVGQVPGVVAYPGAGAFPGVQPAVGYGNGYPSRLADGVPYGLKPGKDMGARPSYNGQPLLPAALGAGPLTYEVPQEAGRMVPDLAAVKYGNGGLRNGFLGAGVPAGGYGQYGIGPAPVQLGAKEGKYPMDGYYGNGYGGCPSGKCV